MVMGIENEGIEVATESDREFLNQVVRILIEECRRSINDHQADHIFADQYLERVDKNGVERLEELRVLLEDNQREIESSRIEKVDFDLLINLLSMFERKFECGYQKSIDRLKKIQEELSASH
jgi:hypothetical protein